MDEPLAEVLQTSLEEILDKLVAIAERLEELEEKLQNLSAYGGYAEDRRNY